MSTAITDVAKPNPSRALQQGRDESHLAIHPISVLHRQQPIEEQGRKVFKKTFPSSRWDNHLKQYVGQSVTLKSNSEDGLPIPFDTDFTVALFGLSWEQNRFTEPKVSFTPHRVLQTMRLAPNGDNYDRLQNSLRRLKAVNVTYTNAYWDRELREYQEEHSHGLVDSYRFYRPKKLKSRQTPTCWIRWNAEFFQQLTDGIVIPLDLDIYFTLKRPTARRIYRVLNRAFSRNNDHYEEDLRTFACGYVGLSEDYDTGVLKSKLSIAITELEDAKTIMHASRTERYRKIKKGIWRIAFDRHREPTPQIASSTATLADDLISRGVTKTIAKRLVAAHPADRIRQKIELLDFLKTTPTEDTPKKPGGWLKTAIEDDYQPPPTFKTAAERKIAQRARRQRDHKQQTQHDLADERSRRDREHNQHLHDEWLPIWNTYSEAKQRQLWKQVHGTTSYRFDNPKHRTGFMPLVDVFRELARRRTTTPNKPE